ncbi:2,3-diaminopropionate biosynthesis protein SbnA [Longimycelium tulufanense]|uniref:2,3-diaminopropionate biosynthesis protein SbnA n=1 Tax=Longimycelium tulufanense TaxID=907463 RepID=A0A8J3C5G5_9PSEU|nr:2,3-diaminopropionate biosynthesis protein SbnA [Longimycelium tulufanense]GGM32887.1 2,3-diaminopropionate biosynthesis protein SbnA [Longimycelium tulufanense]
MVIDHIYDIVSNDIFLNLSDMTPGRELLLKLEWLNPAGSIKLKTALGLLEDAERLGRLRGGFRVIESSSGNLGIALSLACAAKGYPFTCVTDPNSNVQSVALMRSFGADVVMVDRRDRNGGYLGSRIEYIEKRLAGNPDLVWLNQYANPANPRVHANRTAKAIVDELGQVDYLFVGVGTSGTLMGCVSYFRQHSPNTRIVAVDAVGSVTFGFPPGPRRIPGLGTSRRPQLCEPDAVDDIMLVAERDAVRSCRWLARERGLLAGGSTGSVLSAVLRRWRGIPAGARIVALSPDAGERYVETLYNDDWVATNFGVDTLRTDLGHDNEAVAATSRESS